MNCSRDMNLLGSDTGCKFYSALGKYPAPLDSLQYDAIKDCKSLYQAVAAKLTAQGKFYVFLDEVQEVAEWERAINSVMVDFDVDVYVTGSNSRMLSSESSTYLTGRYVSIHVLPLSFAEYLRFKGAYASVNTPKDDICKAAVFQRCICVRMGAKKPIPYRCPRFDLQGKEILKTQEKFYPVDPALKYAVPGYQPASVAAMLENLVYLELRRRGYDVYIGKMADREIDFAAAHQNDRIYVQVSREITTETTAQREYAGLLNIRDNYPKYVLRTDAFAEGNYEGIKTMHIADFLLMESFD